MRSDVFEVVGSAVFFGKKVGALVRFARGAAGAFGGVGAVHEGNVVVSDIAEPAEDEGVSRNMR